MTKHKITFYPENKQIEVDPSITILEAAKAVDVYINSICGGEGTCGKCRVVIKSGEVYTEPTALLTRDEIKQGYVLACLAKPQSDLQIEIPIESRREGEQILIKEGELRPALKIYSKPEEIQRHEEAEMAPVFVHSPLATKLFLKLPLPTLEDNLSDLERLYREIRREHDIPIMQAGLRVVKQLPRLLRGSNWQVTVTLGKRNGTVEVVQVEPGDTSTENYGVAVDVGTTTVVAYLLDLDEKETLGAKATYNTQVTYGEDVITRIIFAEEGGLERLHNAVVDVINHLISDLVTENKIRLNDVIAIMCAGNPTMLHLLLGLDPAYIRREPYIPIADFLPTIRAAEVGIKINPRGLLKCIPGVSSFVGGDITAGVLASGLADSPDLCMLIDIGTNGEVVIGNREWLVCCSTSAGPAFEGSGVRCGMRATKGAIQRVKIEPDNFEVNYTTIGDIPAHGLCGSGYVDCLAELFRAGIVDRAGKIKEEIQTPRIRQEQEIGEGKEFVLAWGEKGSRDVVITETDITNLIRSKAAIYTGATILAKAMGVKLSDLKQIYIGGAFGNYLNIKNAITIGLLPDLPLDKFQFIGNSSITGARMAMLSYDSCQRAEAIAQKMTYFELSTDPNFMSEYVSALFLPHTDANLFPSVKEHLKL